MGGGAVAGSGRGDAYHLSGSSETASPDFPRACGAAGALNSRGGGGGGRNAARAFPIGRRAFRKTPAPRFESKTDWGDKEFLFANQVKFCGRIYVGGGVVADGRKQKSCHPTRVKPEACLAGGFTQLTRLGVRVVWAWSGAAHLVCSSLPARHGVPRASDAGRSPRGKAPQF